MTSNRYQSWPVICGIMAAVLQVLLVFPLAAAYMYREMAWLISPILGAFAALTLLACAFSAIALRRLGYSAWLAAIGLLMPIAPVVLCLVLQERQSPST